MAIIVEDGTGLATANSYVTLADSLAYHVDTAPAWVASTDALRTAALIKATRYIDGKYRRRFSSEKLSQAQALEWPRSWATDKRGYELVGVPGAIKSATCEAALIALTEDLAPSSARGGRIQNETMGPLSTTYEAGAPSETRYPSIERAIEPVVRDCCGGIRIVR